jgi:YD repeat-containing protein
MTAKICYFALIIAVAGLWPGNSATAQTVLFDFDSAPLYTPLPLDLTVGGITAHFSATGQGYSIQRADTLGFTPAGFAGNCIYPSSVYLADLLVGFSRTLTDFSIMFSPEEYGCDSSATMRVTAYMNGTYVGTNTAVADPPGTWPTGTLTFSSTLGFNSVVVHYDSPPPTGGDYGPVFMADNMDVTAIVRGDLNCDGLVNFDDINPFVLALSNPAGYQAAFPNCNILNGDGNGDGIVNFDDINPFLALLSGPPVIHPKFDIRYDYRNRMVEYLDHASTPPGQRHTYAYDVFGRRIRKVVDADGIGHGPTETRFFYGGQADWQVLEEQGRQGATEATYAYGLYIDEVLTMRRDTDGNGTPEDYFYHTDDLYNVVGLTNETGNVVERYEYGDFGAPSTLAPDGMPRAASAVGNCHLLNGLEYDAEQSSFHYRLRHSDPHSGTFTSLDPIGIWGDSREFGNGHGYLGSTGLTHLDPFGNCSSGTNRFQGTIYRGMGSADPAASSALDYEGYIKWHCEPSPKCNRPFLDSEKVEKTSRLSSFNNLAHGSFEVSVNGIAGFVGMALPEWFGVGAGADEELEMDVSAGGGSCEEPVIVTIRWIETTYVGLIYKFHSTTVVAETKEQFVIDCCSPEGGTCTGGTPEPSKPGVTSGGGGTPPPAAPPPPGVWSGFTHNAAGDPIYVHPLPYPGYTLPLPEYSVNSGCFPR